MTKDEIPWISIVYLETLGWRYNCWTRYIGSGLSFKESILNFGMEVDGDYNHAKDMYKRNGDTSWKDAVVLERKKLN